MRTLGALLLAAALACLGWASPRLMASSPTPPITCVEVVSVLDPLGEHVACAQDLRDRGCPDVTPGARYDGCTARGAMPGRAGLAFGVPVDLSTASPEDLRILPGVGPSRAQAIRVAAEKQPLCRWEDLERAKGLGAKRAADLAPFVRFSDPLCEAHRGR